MAKTKKKKSKNREQLLAQLVDLGGGVLASPGALKDPAMKAVIDKLKKSGAGSLDSSGTGTHYNWKGKKI